MTNTMTMMKTTLASGDDYDDVIDSVYNNAIQTLN